MAVQAVKRVRSPFRTVLWIVFSLALLALAAEFSMRAVLGLGHPIVVAPDAACNYIEAPNQHTYRFFHMVDINKYGMRSAPFAPQPAPGALRIMFVGNSVTYGTSRIGQADIFTQILRRELPPIVHRPVEVLNVSAGGWALANELEYVQSRGTFNSGLVLLVLNDSAPAQQRSTLGKGLAQDSTYDHPTTAFGEIWLQYLKPRLKHLAPRRDAGDTVRVARQANVAPNLARLDQFQQLVTAAHGRFAIIYFPFRQDIPQPGAWADAILRQWASDHQVPFFDLTSVEAAQPTAAITLDGVHLNTRGNRLIADGIEKEWASVLGVQ